MYYRQQGYPARPPLGGFGGYPGFGYGYGFGKPFFGYPYGFGFPFFGFPFFGPFFW
ncbi:MAG: hypothetical protein ACOWWO_14895 [Peptococcaceae bacterium]